MQASHKGTDIKHRTWMLRSLITHVNTDSVIFLVSIIIFQKYLVFEKQRSVLNVHIYFLCILFTLLETIVKYFSF